MKEILGKNMRQQLMTLKKRKGEFDQKISEFSLIGTWSPRCGWSRIVSSQLKN